MVFLWFPHQDPAAAAAAGHRGPSFGAQRGAAAALRAGRGEVPPGAVVEEGRFHGIPGGFPMGYIGYI